MNPVVRVVAGVLRDAEGRVLLAQRPAGKHMSGYWEFPGGKMAAGESPEQALARELCEELGVRLRGCHRLLQLRHDYADRTIELDVFMAEGFDGTAGSLEGQAIKWVRVPDLGDEELLPADRPIIDALEAASIGTATGAPERADAAAA